MILHLYGSLAPNAAGPIGTPSVTILAFHIARISDQVVQGA